jgi:2-keto-4-pentenoate hydratase/2-oxohepta-3-ene-1,7-dioic acid hydratase in catechol pathway
LVCDMNFSAGDETKSFETFCPLGPWIETDFNPMDCRVRCRLSGQTLQDGRTSLMIFSIPFLAEVEIDGIGTLRNPVTAEG